MPSINVDLDYRLHRKTRLLVRLLGKGADVLPIRLWLYCGKFHAGDGRLEAYSAQEIEQEVDWWGKPGDAVAALVEAGFLEQISDGFAVHDWLDHSGHLVAYHLRAKNGAKVRWEKAKLRASASSNASSNPSSFASVRAVERVVSSAESEPQKPSSDGGLGEGFATDAPADPSLWPHFLAGLWNFHHKGTAPSQRDLERLDVFFADLIKRHPPEKVRDRIRDPARKATQATWDFEKELEDAAGQRGSVRRDRRSEPGRVRSGESYEAKVVDRGKAAGADGKRAGP